ncbi:AraC family transcriptional regulator [Paenibacillus sp. LMG 31460]|uniref:AraC family transcriptional regulator n=1 Tax=Paenibacillus germinis TaxID=2654979 RepID=A0ABX1Z5U7_9BACL|nr:AraC family transcriptional regulator [Paenibacillus germinis]
MNWITSYFYNHLSESLSLDEMAKRARLSSSRFSALFKEKFGVSPINIFYICAFSMPRNYSNKGTTPWKISHNFADFQTSPISQTHLRK